MTDNRSLRPLRVLVVDDREESRYLFTTWLRRSGFQVDEAADGTTALSLLTTVPFDLAVLDVNLPDMTGFEISERIRASPRTSAMGIIHVSATAVAPSDRSEGLLRGADAFLVEPIEPSDLLATITALIRRSGIRERLDLTTRRLRALNRVTADVHAASDDEQLFDAVLSGLCELGGGAATVLRRDTARMIQRENGLVGERSIDIDLIEQVLEPAVAGENSLHAPAGALFQRAHVGVPFVDENGEPAGALLIPDHVEGAHGEVMPMLAQLAVAITLARANMNALDIEHRMALVLQNSLLPQAPPTMVGVTVDFRYLASSRHAEVGGDFYEAIDVAADRLLFAIGDVVGHSLLAATVMGEIRHTIRALAFEGYTPDQITERIDRLIRRVHPNMYTTMVCGLLDTSIDQISLCNAGHLPPLLVRADSSTNYIAEHGPLLGLGAFERSAQTVRFPPGVRLVLVTDGLIERRGVTIQEGLGRLEQKAAETREHDPSVAIDEIVAAIGPEGTPGDDIAIMIIERTAHMTCESEDVLRPRA